MSQKIAILFCSGPSISKYSKVIPKLVKKFTEKENENFTNIGVNQFPIEFVKNYMPKYKKLSVPVDYWMFVDEITCSSVINNYNAQKLLINSDIGQEKLKLFEDEQYNVDCLFEHGEQCNLENDNKLYGMYSTPLKAIHYLLKKDYNVVILGMDNIITEDGKWEHFYPEQQVSDKTLDQIIDIRIQLDELSKLGNIYKIDQANNIEVPLISIEELLNGNIVIAQSDTAIEEEVIKMQLPEFINGQVLHIEDQQYEIVDKLVSVKLDHVNELLQQGFKIV